MDVGVAAGKDMGVGGVVGTDDCGVGEGVGDGSIWVQATTSNMVDTNNLPHRRLPVRMF